MKKRAGRINRVLEIILWIFSIVTLYPLFMVLVTSFKTKAEASYMSIKLPEVWQFSNYAVVLEQDFVQNLGNSVFISVITVLVELCIASITAFVLVRRDTKGCRIINKIISLCIIAPFAAMPTIQLLRTMGMYGTRLSLCCVYSVLNMPLSVMLFSSSIKEIPRELDEAAVMDGAYGFSIFWRVILPIAKPTIATVAIMVFMSSWNELQIPLYLLNSSSKYTLPLSVYNFYGLYQNNWNLVCADVIMVSLPVVLVYVFAQKYVISGMTAGAVKG